jgi:hypothetical protein
MIEEIIELTEKEDEAGVIALLKTLTPELKKKLAPSLKKAVKAGHDYVHEGPMALLFLGSSLLNGDKTLSSLAAETWLRAASTGNIDNGELGRIIGQLEKAGYAPLKRLTDLMTMRMFKVSPAHIDALRTLIDHILPELPEKPTGFRRLLEIHKELV